MRSSHWPRDTACRPSTRSNSWPRVVVSSLTETLSPMRIGKPRPMSTAFCAATPNSAKAWPRFSGGKESARIDCATGTMPPPPRPCRTRNSNSACRFGANPPLWAGGIFAPGVFSVASPLVPRPLGREAPGAVVRLRIIDRRSLRDDAQGIEPRDRPVIDDVVARLHRLGDARHLVELAHVVCEIGVVGDPLLVASNNKLWHANLCQEVPSPLLSALSEAIFACWRCQQKPPG